MTRLDGAVVLVLGASGGLGRLLADSLEARGAVAVRSGRDCAALGEAPLVADLRGEDEPRRVVAEVLERHGRLDGVVVAAGVVAFGPSAELDPAVLEELVEVNALAPIRVLTAALPSLVASAGEGREPFALTISGVVAEAPTAGLAAYSASKAALHSFVKASAREYKRAGVLLLDARPGHTETELSRHPLAGDAPRFGAGLAPQDVVDRLLDAVEDGETDLPPAAFTG
ncbi:MULTISPECIES: SDR family oxidoreductase [unclassified Rathayibacter]|uniref:SDR family NAD(P)-dependent oxidoreductase n=1 Tax=unclassified Rathayibacter TaxID=2609250 RepID=UPI000CE74E16|nr:MULTISPECIES: SDR family NAD(P)-dependent oxidoreductase [unclassified Rathayibacter]PPF12758.1 short-chain dehydrogenase [Rathayibacter sp. AY1A5]PPF30207.1 short-chain dehydrogenase [Rathayibacter sp. AY1F2]PPH48793.1 short-chain dehydrogenase [Rathayibacter sp. AY1F7]